MIFLKRRRLFLWLFKAYFKKWRKTIFLSFAFGLIVFFILRFGFNYFIPLIPFSEQETVGLVGAYSSDNLPYVILSKLSHGLTSIDPDDRIRPDIASSWEIKNEGKTYIFHLKDNVFFADGTKVTSEEVKYNFLDVSVERPNKQTIIFNLKNKYSPFLVTVSRPLFKKDFLGVSDYKMQSLNVNGDFVQSVSLVSTSHVAKEISYQFYPTEESLKTAFVLGEVTKINGVKNLDFETKTFKDFPNVEITKKLDYSQLVTLFYNSNDRNLSDKRLREALSYTMPDIFADGERNYGSFSPKSWVSEDGLSTYQQDLEHSKSLLSQALGASSSGKLNLTLQTLPQYKKLADKIKDIWKLVGINAKVEVVQSLPQTFQVFLGDFNVPKDPDQYTLWHSSAMNNITSYKNLRIDKLLEDGRQTVDINERKKIYADFQKYLLDDPPAAFLYFPYVYEIKRK